MINMVVPFVYRGPRPKDIKELRDRGITRILCLESRFRDLFFEDKYETQLPTAYDIREMYVDMSGIWCPERHDVLQAVEIIKQAIKDNVLIYVHCMAGKDRTGFVIAVFRMQYCGWTYNDAVKEYKAMGLHYRYYWWLRELKKYEVKK